MTIKVDKKDKELLMLIYLDSRTSFTEMGKKLKLSSSAVERRLRRLQADGVVVLLFADVNFAKLGLKPYRLYFKFDVMDDKTEREVLELFESYSRTVWGVICEGEYDVLWRIIAKDEIEVEKALALVLQNFGKKIVEKTVISTSYQTYLSWNKALDAPRHPELPIERVAEIELPDKLDIHILSCLYQNARESTVNIAKKVGLTSDSVQYRIKNLVKQNYILGYTAWYDAKKLGFNYYKLLIGLRNINPGDESKFLDFCKEHDDVIFLNKAIGSWDIELDIIVRNNSELHQFTKDIKTKFGHVIGKHHFISVVEERMLNPLR
ncbi:MAG: Lrp/AsnC family transcriptional regulator [Candidatus Micrarchaeota archaeon]